MDCGLDPVSSVLEKWYSNLKIFHWENMQREVGNCVMVGLWVRHSVYLREVGRGISLFCFGSKGREGILKINLVLYSCNFKFQNICVDVLVNATIMF